MCRPWSKLQREVNKLIDKNIKFQIHCVAYRMDSQRGSSDIPRYWITLGKETLWDYPKGFMKEDSKINLRDDILSRYPYGSDVSDISVVLREYIDTPKELIYEKHFEKDIWGLIDLLKAADKRIGKRRLTELKNKSNDMNVIKIIDERMKKVKLLK